MFDLIFAVGLGELDLLLVSHLLLAFAVDWAESVPKSVEYVVLLLAQDTPQLVLTWVEDVVPSLVVHLLEVVPQLVKLWVEDAEPSWAVRLPEAVSKRAALLVGPLAVHLLVLALRFVENGGLLSTAHLGSALPELEILVQSSAAHLPKPRLHVLAFLGLSATVHLVISLLHSLEYGCSHEGALLEKSALHWLAHVLLPWAVPLGESVVQQLVQTLQPQAGSVMEWKLPLAHSFYLFQLLRPPHAADRQVSMQNTLPMAEKEPPKSQVMLRYVCFSLFVSFSMQYSLPMRPHQPFLLSAQRMEARGLEWICCEARFQDSPLTLPNLEAFPGVASLVANSVTQKTLVTSSTLVTLETLVALQPQLLLQPLLPPPFLQQPPCQPRLLPESLETSAAVRLRSPRKQLSSH